MSQYKLMRGIILSALGLALSAGFFIPFQFINAQVPCGEIIVPPNYYQGTEEERTPIADCNDPFEVTNDVANPYTVYINNNAITPGATIVVPPTGADAYRVEGDPYLMGFDVTYYKHDGPNYEQVRTNFDQVPEDRLAAYAETYFTDPTVRALYQEIAMSPLPEDYFYDENGNDVLDSEGQVVAERYNDFYYSAAANIQIPLQPGIYTAVITEYELFQTYRSFFDQLREFVIPTAYANHDTGPYPRYVFAITFTIANEPPPPTGASSVLFLPGIQASRLYKGGLFGTEDEIWTPDGNQDVRQLAMNTDGESINDVYVRDILLSVPFVGPTVYGNFTNFMNQLASSTVIDSWVPFAYDWRYGVDDTATNGTQYKDEIKNAITLIEKMATSSHSKKVTIIGHSNGGLLAKLILQKLESEGKANLIDKVIFLASPQLGTPKAIGTILHGFDQEKAWGWLIDDVVARDVIQNMPGAYGLITSEKYLNTAPDKIIRFENSTATAQFRSLYGDTIDSKDELQRFMTGTSDGRTQATTIDEVLNANDPLISNALALHEDYLDNWLAPAGVEVVEIIGTGLDTVSGFEYRSFKERFCMNIANCVTKDVYKPVPIISRSGDKTVMALSAEAYEGQKKQYFIDLDASDIRGGEYKVEHYNISENPSILTLVKNILMATTSNIEFITQTKPITNKDKIMFGSHSPVDMEVTDSSGRRVGKIAVNGTSTIKESIPGSSYFEIGSSKYIIVPKLGDYKIKVIGTGDGNLTFTQDLLIGDTQIATYSIAVATITPSTTINIGFNNDLSNLEIDSNSDGSTDQVLSPSGIDVTPKITYSDLRLKINSLTLSPAKKLPLLLLVEAADQFDKKSATNPKLTQLEILALNQLEALLVTYNNKKWINQADLDGLKFIINKLK